MESRSLLIFSVKIEAKLAVTDVDEAEEGKKDDDFRWSSLLAVCQRRRGLSEEEETKSE